jgi:2'-5' RNA ligase
MTSQAGQRVRSFVAIELPPEVRDALAGVQACLRPLTKDVRWVAPEGIHLTLKFLDGIPAAMVPRVAGALALLEASAPPALRLDSAGAFPNWRAPRVIWVGLGGDIEALSVLRGRVEQVLRPLGFSPDLRPFSPHLTLGRVRDNARPEGLRDLAGAAQALKVEPAPFRADGVTLFQSRLTPSGAVYTALARVSLFGHSGS